MEGLGHWLCVDCGASFWCRCVIWRECCPECGGELVRGRGADDEEYLWDLIREDVKRDM